MYNIIRIYNCVDVTLNLNSSTGGFAYGTPRNEYMVLPSLLSKIVPRIVPNGVITIGFVITLLVILV